MTYDEDAKYDEPIGNPYDSNYRTKIDGEEYKLGLVDFAEYPPKGYVVYDKDRNHVFIPCLYY